MVCVVEKHDTRASSGPRRVGARCLFVSFALALVKLCLVSGDEIGASYPPNDDLWYLHSAKEWYWLGAYSDAPFLTPPFIRLPIDLLFVSLTTRARFPLRISTDQPVLL